MLPRAVESRAPLTLISSNLKKAIDMGAGLLAEADTLRHIAPQNG